MGPGLASLGLDLALGKAGIRGMTGIAVRGRAGFADFAGVLLVAVDALGGWTELGVVGEVESVVSEGTS